MDTKIIPQDKLKDVLISRTAEKLQHSEDVVEKIISFEFKEARDAIKQFAEVEISGFGTFKISQAKLRKKLRRILLIQENFILKMEREGDQMTEKRKELFLARIDKNRGVIEYLKSRLV